MSDDRSYYMRNSPSSSSAVCLVRMYMDITRRIISSGIHMIAMIVCIACAVGVMTV